jgi:hypothetical protein
MRWVAKKAEIQKAGATIFILLAIAACGGNSGNQPTSAPTPSPTTSPAPSPTTTPTPTTSSGRFSPSSYPAFATTRDTSNLEGTWLGFVNGWVLFEESPLVSGLNLRNEHHFKSRTTIRIKIDSNDRYVLYACGPAGAKSTNFSRYPSPAVEVPFVPYYEDPSWFEYTFRAIDAVTLVGSMEQEPIYVGQRGRRMSWNLSWTVKRISDDPFAYLASVVDNLASQAEESGCIFEAEGTYSATEDDAERQDFSREGSFGWIAAFPTTLLDDTYFRGAQFLLEDYEDYRKSYRVNESYFDSAMDDQFEIGSAVSGNTSEHSVQIRRPEEPQPVVDAVLGIDL